MSGVQTLTPCGFLCVSTMSFSRKLSNPCNRLWNWHGVEYLFVEWMNGMDGWLDEQMLILSIVSHLHQLMTWSSGISLSTLGWEPWLEVERVPSEGQLCPPEKPLDGWCVCQWPELCAVPSGNRHDATEQLCPLCAPKRWAACMSPCWWFICGGSWNSRGIL